MLQIPIFQTRTFFHGPQNFITCGEPISVIFLSIHDVNFSYVFMKICTSNEFMEISATKMMFFQTRNTVYRRLDASQTGGSAKAPLDIPTAPCSALPRGRTEDELTG
jgi:hypothetical protein